MTYQYITKSTPTNGPSSIVFSSIPQTYKDLVLVYVFRSNEGANAIDFLRISVNSAGKNFRYVTQSNTNNTANNSYTNFTTVSYIGSAGVPGAVANQFGSGMFYFGDYTASTSGSTIYQTSALPTFNTATVTNQGASFVISGTSGAITSITLTTQSGSSIVTGTSVYLYGVS